MTFGVSGTGPAAALAALGRTSTATVDPVQPVQRDKPAPERGFDASGGGSGSGGVAAMLLGRGGTSTADIPVADAPDTTASKPNLDALNRVLAHYLAQSQAAARSLRTLTR